MVDEIKHIVSKIIDINKKIKDKLSSDNIEELDSLVTQKGENILKLQEFLKGHITKENINDLTILMECEGEVSEMVKSKIKQAQDTLAKNRLLLKNLSKYLMLASNITQNLSLMG